MALDRIGRLLLESGKIVTLCFNHLSGELAERADMARLYNEVYFLSSRACAESVHESAKQIAAARLEPRFLTYKAIMNEAIAMLARGDSQSDVVFHFDVKVAKEYGRMDDV